MVKKSECFSYFVSVFIFKVKAFFSHICCIKANHTSLFMILENTIAVLRIILHCRGGSTIQQPNDSVVHVLDVVYFPLGYL